MDDITVKKPAATKPKISDEERARRQKAVDYARGSLRLEGFIANEEVEELGRRYVAGDITLTEHSAAIKQRYSL